MIVLPLYESIKYIFTMDFVNNAKCEILPG